MKNPVPISISGFGVASGLGCDENSLRQSLRQGRRALSKDHRFAEWVEAPLGELPWVDLGIKVSDPLATDQMMKDGCAIILDQLARETAVFQRFRPERIGLFVGTTTSGITGFFEGLKPFREGQKPFHHYLSPNMQQASLMHELMTQFPLHGPAWTLSSSCAASAHALLLAHDALQTDMVDAALVIGVDILNLVTIHGFEALQVLDHQLCAPFTQKRQGINLAEVIAMLLLEKGESGSARLRNHHALSEAHHMTQPAPEGTWMQATMAGALHKAQLMPKDIDYINPHGTGTEANDRTEAAAIARLFPASTAFHPSKRYSGHTLGASGAFEAIVSCLMLDELENPLLHQYSAHDLNSGGEGQKIATPASSRERGPRLALSNSFGFGGANVSLIIEKLS